MKFILAPLGSAGDVHPFIWMGKILRGRGHEVVVVAGEGVKEMPERAGLRTVTWGNAAIQEELIKNPDLWHPRRAFPLIMKHAVTWAEELVPVLMKEVVAGETVVLGGALAFGARAASERWGVPLLTVHLQPSVMMSVMEPPVMAAGLEWLPGSPMWVRRAFFNVGNWHVDRMLREPLKKIRGGLGIEGEVRRWILKAWWHSPDGAICLFPGWYAKKAVDWPEQAVTTRFPLYDETGDRPLEAGLEEFLQGGEAPVVITPGSANAHAGRFLEEGVKGAVKAGKRVVIVTRYLEQVPKGLPETVRAFSYVPFSQVFGRASCVIHHGGIGTMAQCFKAGVPQLMMPLAHDQPDNAWRVKRFGAGDYLYPKKFKAGRVAAAVKGLVENAGVRKAAAGMRQHIESQMTEAEMGALIEEMSGRAVAARAAGREVVHAGG